MKVFIADDSDLILERLQESLLVFQNLTIVGVSKSGAEALRNLKILKPDLAIIDLEMPELNGFDVIKEIRKVDRQMKIIVLTFYSSDYYFNKAIQLGSDYFFSKADDFDKISFVVAGMVLEESKIRNKTLNN
jgi:DNA-binding NarL/FixJ family response regulator